MAAVAAVVAAGCGPGAVPGEGGGGEVDAAEEKQLIDATDPGGQIGDPCERAQQCQGELICDPDSKTCAEPFPCEEHADCGAGAHCNDEGMCEKSGQNSPCDRDLDCAAEDVCIGGFCGCSGAVFEAEPVDVNMLVVLDRSGSMYQDVTGEPADPIEEAKWYVAQDAIDYMLEEFGERANFGVSVFPHAEIATEDACTTDDDPIPDCSIAEACYEASTLVEVGDGTEGEIRTALDETLPACCTPTGDSLDSYLGYEPLSDPDAENFILLVADGKETCGGDGPAAAAALRAQDENVRTFAVGFGGGVDEAELEAIAEQGGTARDGDLKYYQADSAEELEAAFEDIGGRALVCNYALDSVPDDPDDLHAYFDGEPVDRDPTRQDGWDYDAGDNSIEFYGPACDALQSGDVEDLAILRTCDLIIE